MQSQVGLHGEGIPQPLGEGAPRRRSPPVRNHVAVAIGETWRRPSLADFKAWAEMCKICGNLLEGKESRITHNVYVKQQYI